MAKEFVYTPVESSNIAKVGYNAEDQLLEITFHDFGGVYWYFKVPQYLVDNLVTAESVGKFFNAHIKKNFVWIKVTNFKQDPTLDAILYANVLNHGTPAYRKFSDLCDLMGWDFVEAWDLALYRTEWMDYQDIEYKNLVYARSTKFRDTPTKEWPAMAEEL